MGKNREKMMGFNILKFILGGIFKVYYNPIIIGEENIPEKGSMIFVGNHFHIMDQCLPILSTKRAVHYLAKKEYFDDFKVSWFFKLAGCIPVDRNTKDDLATTKALQVLENGYVLGLFPEGTRNSLKKEKIDQLYTICKSKYPEYKEFVKLVKGQKTSYLIYIEELISEGIISENDLIDNVTNINGYLLSLVDKGVISKKDYDDRLLLPFKFGAVSLAKKTDSYIIPFGITGEYKFRSKDLVIRIGKPMKVGDNLEVANKELAEAVAKLIRIDIKNSGK